MTSVNDLRVSVEQNVWISLSTERAAFTLHSEKLVVIAKDGSSQIFVSFHFGLTKPFLSEVRVKTKTIEKASTFKVLGLPISPIEIFW